MREEMRQQKYVSIKNPLTIILELVSIIRVFRKFLRFEMLYAMTLHIFFEIEKI
jgi:uncharacterized membrane protein